MPTWRVKRRPRKISGRHSPRAIRSPASRPPAHAQSVMTAPPIRKRIQASRIGGASTSPILIATGLAPQRIETSMASVAPLRSMPFAGWLRAPPRYDNCHGVREAGVDGGWAETEARGVDCSGVREAGVDRGWAETEARGFVLA